MSCDSFLAQVIPRISHLVDSLADGPHSPPDSPGGVLVALSGGPDSVALLLAAEAWSRESGRPVVAAHFNHNLRGSEADADELFCQNLCVSLQIPLHIRHGDPRGLARSRGRGLEEAGRILRRRFLADVLERQPELICAATAHHFDDQAETVVMRVFRGTGLDGLRGIPAIDGRIIHPLLDQTRAEIIEFLQQRGQAYRIDATNAKGDAVRSRLRRELFPLARDIFGAGAARSPGRLAGLAADDLELLDELTSRTLGDLDISDGSLSVSALLSMGRPLARRVLRRFLADQHGITQDFELVHFDSLLTWLQGESSGTGVDLPHGLRAHREFDRLSFATAESAPPVATSGDFRLIVESQNTDQNNLGEKSVDSDTVGRRWSLTCPAKALSGNLRLRTWRDGDRIRTLGLKGHKKISDLLQERRVAAGDRPGILVIEDDRGILWVVGLARAERTRMLPTAEPAVTIHVIADDKDVGPMRSKSTSAG